MDSPWERIVGGLVLGSQEFVSQVLEPSGAKAAEDETKAWHARMLRPEWQAIVAAAERIGGQEWSKTILVHGNWFRDAVLYTAVRHLGYRLAEVYRGIPGLKYPAAAAAVKRFGGMLVEDPARRRFVQRLRRALER